MLLLCEWNWPVCDIFLDLFSSLFSLVFSLNCGYLFCLTCRTMKTTIKEQRENSERKKINSKKIRGHLFMWFASLKFGPPSLTLFANIKFWSEVTPILNVVNWHSIWHSEFSSKTLKIRSKSDRPAFFLCTIFIILISMVKLEAKRTDFHQIDICERLIYLQCLHYRTTTQL